MLTARFRSVLLFGAGVCGGLLSLSQLPLEGTSLAKPAKQAKEPKPAKQPPAPATPPPPPITLSYVAGSSKRVLRLFPNPSANLQGSERGVSFEHDGKVWFLFGDTLSRFNSGVPAASMPITEPMRATPPRVADSAGSTLKLRYVRDGREWPLSGFEVPVAGLSLPVRTVKPLATEPAGWIGSPNRSDIPSDAAPLVNQMPQTGYAVFKVCEDRTKCAPTNEEDPKNKDQRRESVLVRFDAQGLRNVYLRTISKESEWAASGTEGGKFVNVSMVYFDGPVPNVKAPGPYVFLFGTGKQSNPYLQIVPAESLATGQDTLYYAGVDPKKGLKWSKLEADAQPIFEDQQPTEKGPEMGELSVAFLPEFGKWIMTYDVKAMRKVAKPIAAHMRPLTNERELCTPTPKDATKGPEKDDAKKDGAKKPDAEFPTREVILRASSLPWTGWSPRQTIFNPVADKAFGEYIYDAHQTTERNYMLTPKHVPTLAEWQSTCRSGSVASPFLVPQLFKWVTDEKKRERLVITWTLSTYKPYYVYLMQSELDMQRPTSGVAAAPAAAPAAAAPGKPAAPGAPPSAVPQPAPAGAAAIKPASAPAQNVQSGAK